MVLVLVAAVLLAAGAGFIAIFVASQQGRGPASQLSYPMVWVETYPVQGAVGSAHSIDLKENGTAVVFDLLVGAVAEGADGDCIDDASPYTGSGRWSLAHDYTIRIETDAGTASLTPTSFRFGEGDWTDLGEWICDRAPDDVTYGLQTDRRRSSGSP
jgi:hypothetical protein